ncbi:hypothetical protein ABZ845_20605 [Streptomyces sp. NPDC047022]|uniref:hypothetical protein n=1 Tax=Streptomyces sp. NPDC047022 TaxID=3155737 RepID=UPI0033D5C2CF
MSYNQPGPYGGQPQQPGPYGQPGQPGPYGQPGQPAQPGPYGQQQPQAPQPGYGYPPQTPQGGPGYAYPPQAPQGVPQQQNPYGQPGQPGPYGQQPYGQQPYGQQPYGVPQPPAPGGGKKKTALIITGAVAVVAAIAVGAYLALGGSSDSVADDGPHKLVPPAAVGEYKKADSSFNSDDGGPAGTSSAAKLKAMGIEDGQIVRASYSTGGVDLGKAMALNGAYGKIADPEAAIDRGFDNSHRNSQNSGSKGTVTWKGSPESVKPSGLDGALMKCQVAHVSEGADNLDTPVCIWADHSTYGVVNGLDLAAAKTGGGFSQDDVAAFATKLRSAARVKA